MAWTICFVVTFAISLVTKAKPEAELEGLVYSLTEKPRTQGQKWFENPYVLAAIVLAVTTYLNYKYW